MKTLNKKLNYKGFTLVELIVVISILAILSTIAFLSFGGFSSKARDGTRISDTSSLSKGLELYQVKSGYYPKPEGTLTEGTINGTVVAYKGEIQDQISSLTKISKTPKDPLSNSYYIYGTTLDYKQYQVATTLENSLSFQDGIGEKAYADGPSYQAKVTGNYKGLIKFTDTSSKTWLSNIPSLIYNSGADLTSTGTIYSIDKSTNLPYSIQNASIGTKDANAILQQLTGTSATLTKVDITNIKTKEQIVASGALFASLGFDTSIIEKVVVNGPTVVGQSGSVVTTPQYPGCNTAGTILTATSKYTGCNTYDIILCSGAGIGYTISACNVGSTTAGTTSTSYGNYFQFGKKDTSWTNGYSGYSYDWKASGGINGGSANDWGIEESEKETAIYSNQNIADQDKMKGPCDIGYHVPSILEWSGILTAGLWGTNAASMSVALKLPLVGYRDFTGYTWANGGGYRSSSPNEVSGYALRFSGSTIYPKSGEYRGNGFAIRCIKN